VSESPGDSQPETSGPSQSSSPQQNSGPPQDSSPPQRAGPPQDSSPPQRAGPSQNSGSSQNSGPKNSGPKNSGQTRTNGQPGSRNQSGSGRSPSRGSDPVADFQRWLMKAGARSMANQVADQVKRTVGAERRTSGDVWDTATNEPPPNEPPECQWCPVCQAARAARTGGAGALGARLADAGGVLASVVQDAFSAFEQVMKTQDQNRSTERPGASPPPKSASDHGETGQ
jgi:hypothetical protein